MKTISTRTKKRSNFSSKLIKLCERSQIEGSVLLSKLHTLVKYQQIMTVTLMFSYTILFRFSYFFTSLLSLFHMSVITLIDLFVFTFVQHNIPCELTDVNVFNGEHREPKFVAMNPHEEVPILADGSTTVFGGFVTGFLIVAFFSRLTGGNIFVQLIWILDFQWLISQLFRPYPFV